LIPYQNACVVDENVLTIETSLLKEITSTCGVAKLLGRVQTRRSPELVQWALAVR
jgi:hypothetical protein